MNTSSLVAARAHLANLLEAVQRCTYFLYASASKADWPLDVQDSLVKAASRLVALCAQSLGVMPATSDFESEFQRVCTAIGA